MSRQKKKASKRKKAAIVESQLPTFQWMAEEGIHMAAPGLPPTPEQLERMTQAYQKKIRNSALWDTMVKEFGQEKAEEMLKEFEVKLG
jgi:hypothetical protein